MVLSSVLLEIANQVVQRSKLYGLVQVLIRLDFTMNIIIAIQTKLCKRTSWNKPSGAPDKSSGVHCSKKA